MTTVRKNKERRPTKEKGKSPKQISDITSFNVNQAREQSLPERHQIALCAYELWEKKGYRGSELDNWLEAERLLTDGFSLILESVGDNELQVIRSIRDETGLQLSRVKTFVEKSPGSILQGLSRQQAEALIESTRKAGASMEFSLMEHIS